MPSSSGTLAAAARPAVVSLVTATHRGVVPGRPWHDAHGPEAEVRAICADLPGAGQPRPQEGQ